MKLIFTKKALVFFTGLLGFLTYFPTLAPTITWRNNGADSGDFAAAVAVNGVPHPPGYPTYLLLAELFERLPFGDVAYRLNLLSAVCAALTIALTALAIFESLKAASATKNSVQLHWLCAASAALTLAFADLLWSQAVIAEVYALNGLFAAFILYGAVRAGQAAPTWLVAAVALAMGLSLGNHLSILFFFPVGANVLANQKNRRVYGPAISAFCLGLAVYVLLPLRAGRQPPINWGGADNWSNFWWLVTAQLYRTNVFGLPLALVPARLVSGLQFLMAAFMWWGFPVGLLGLYRLMHSNRTLALSSLLSFGLFAGYAIGYDTADSFVYFLPALILFAMWLGWGLFDVGETLLGAMTKHPRWKSRILWPMLGLPLISLLVNVPHQNISGDFEAHTFAQQSLASAAPGALIITRDDARTFALWYARYGQNVRPDVTVVNGNLLIYDWYRQTLGRHHPQLHLANQAGQPVQTIWTVIEQNIDGMPIYLALANPQPGQGYRLEPALPLHRVLRN